MSGSGREALSDVQEWSIDPPRCPGVDGRPTRKYGSGRKFLPEVRESLSDVRKWSGGPPGCPGVVGRPSRMSEVVGRPSWMSGNG